jgi:PKD repeat protein
MRKLLLLAPIVAAIIVGCQSSPPTGPGIVKITETTTSTTTSTTTTTTTSTIPTPTQPVVTFSPLTPEILQIVNFTAANSIIQQGRSIVRYEWDFGDGVLKTGPTTTHDYFPSGTYLVTLKLTDNQGTVTTAEKPITVRPVVP